MIVEVTVSKYKSKGIATKCCCGNNYTFTVTIMLIKGKSCNCIEL